MARIPSFSWLTIPQKTSMGKVPGDVRKGRFRFQQWQRVRIQETNRTGNLFLESEGTEIPGEKTYSLRCLQWQWAVGRSGLRPGSGRTLTIAEVGTHLVVREGWLNVSGIIKLCFGKMVVAAGWKEKRTLGMGLLGVSATVQVMGGAGRSSRVLRAGEGRNDLWGDTCKGWHQGSEK